MRKPSHEPRLPVEATSLAACVAAICACIVCHGSAHAEVVELSDGTRVEVNVEEELETDEERKPRERLNAVTTGVAGLGIQWWNIAYRRAPSDDVSLRIGPSFLRVSNEDQTVQMTSLHLGMDYQFGSSGLTGPYVGGQLQYGVASVETTDDVLLVGTQNDRSTYLAFGAISGYRWIWGPGITFGAGAGLAFVTTLEQRSTNIFIQGVVPLLDLHLGYAF